MSTRVDGSAATKRQSAAADRAPAASAGLLDLALGVHASLDLGGIAATIEAWLRRELPHLRGVALFVENADGDSLEPLGMAGEWPAAAPVAADSEHPAARARGSGGVVWISGGDADRPEPVTVPARQRAARNPPITRWEGYLALPASEAGGKCPGVLGAALAAAPVKATESLLRQVAQTAAAAVANAREYLGVVESHSRMTDLARRQASIQVETELLARGERALNRLHDVIHESTDPERIVQAAAPLLRTALNASRCIGLLSTEGEYRDFAVCDPDYPLDTSEVVWETTEAVRELERTLRPAVLCADPGAEPDPGPADGPRLELWEPAASILAVPALHRRRLSAIFMLHHCGGPRTWTDGEVSLAMRAASQVASALHNARLYRTAVTAGSFQRTLVEVQTAVAARPELETILEAIAQHGMALLNADAAYVWRVDRVRQELVGVVGVGHRAERFAGLRAPVGRGRSLAVAAHTAGGPIVSNDMSSDPRVNQRLRRLLDCRAAVAVPLKTGDECLGVVVFSYRRAGARIERDDVRRAQVLVTEAAQAIQSAQLYAEARRRVKEWQILAQISQTISEDLDEKHVVRTLVEGTSQILRADACSLLIRSPESGEFAVRYHVGLSLEHVRALQATMGGAKGAPLPNCLAVDGAQKIVSDLSQKRCYPPVAMRDGLRSLLSVPLAASGKTPRAVLTVYGGRDREFTIEDLEALSTVASFGLAALSNASRYDRQRKIALALQAPLLPTDELPEDALAIAGRTVPALREADIGGDYFDTISLPDGRLAVAMGDVCGKGLAAAVQTQSLRWMMRSLVQECSEPSRLLERLNRLLVRYVPAEGFVTLFYGLFDTERRQLRYANAGHLPGLLSRQNSPELYPLAPTGLVLGVEPTAEYDEGEVTMEAGDTLLLYTDGLTDARSQGRLLDIEGVAQRFRAVLARGLSGPHQVADGLFDEVIGYAEGVLTDDATLMVLQPVAPASAAARAPEPAAGEALPSAP